MRYALANSQPSYILLLNNDTVVGPEFLTEMVKVGNGDATIGVAGAKIYYHDNPNQLQFVWGKIDLWRGRVVQTPKIVAERIKNIELDNGQYDHIEQADWVTSCCFCSSAVLWNKFGYLMKIISLIGKKQTTA